MLRPRRHVALSILLIPSILLCGPALAQLVAGDRPDVDELADSPPVALEPAPGLPQPVEPPPVPSGDAGPYELVGFTPLPQPPNKGVLNYTLACQQRFANSRMCTVAEVNATVHVPLEPGYGHAWVRGVDGQSAVTAWSGPEEPRPKDMAELPNDCNGWTSNSSLALGTAMDFGSRAECYGGFHAVSCDRELVVACCAQRGTATN